MERIKKKQHIYSYKQITADEMIHHYSWQNIFVITNIDYINKKTGFYTELIKRMQNPKSFHDEIKQLVITYSYLHILCNHANCSLTFYNRSASYEHPKFDTPGLCSIHIRDIYPSGFQIN